MSDIKSYKPTSPNKHLIPAYLTWMFENDPKVFFTCIVDHPEVSIVPSIPQCKYTNYTHTDGKEYTTLTCNIHLDAVSNFTMGKTGLNFMCRMDGKAVDIYAPYDSIIAVFCPNSPLLHFNLPLAIDKTSSKAVYEEKSKPLAKSKAHLTIIK